MSGSGSDVGGYVGSGTSDPCEKLRLTRYLEGPVESVVATLQPDDILTVDLRGESPPLVVVVTSTGEEAGGILPTGQLIDCLTRGVRFDARVIRINDAAIELDVRAAT